ncbi:hypothetical protein CFIO01_02142 [Colletotrichum fioriniae PJ7]|uniref:F-box domain-containing protein n=1 Tax=Colletotrichum fioriniae PJ7 TaxID=1445577 RepID=A0A010S2U3_9PEZI|nr:hypothetical protein CFIO01_02142 [Colletotrichum fioriniae PJ7]
MASISSLPPEMLGEIAACFQDDTPLGAKNDWTADQKTLAILSRVSKPFQYAAQPLLYRKIYLFVREPAGINIISLIKVLYHRKDLRSKVDKVQIHFEEEYSYPLGRTKDEVQNLRHLARNIGQKSLCRALQGSSGRSGMYRKVLSSLLFSQLQGVSQVKITELYGPDFEFDYRKLDRFGNAWSVLPCLLIPPSEAPEALLQNLVSLYLDAHGTTTMRLSDYHLLARLAPNLGAFSGRRFKSIPVEAFNHFKKLKHLSLVDAPLEDKDSPYQGGFLEIPPGLQYFQYSMHFPYFSGKLNIPPMKVQRALAERSDTVNDIHIDFSQGIAADEDEMFDTFEMFKRLEHLSVNPVDFESDGLMGSGPTAFITTLPRSLQSLTILNQDRYRHRYRCEDILWLADAVQKGDFENLESFTIHVTDEDRNLFHTIMGEIWGGIDKPESGEDEASFCVKVVSETDSRELRCYW